MGGRQSPVRRYTNISSASDFRASDSASGDFLCSSCRKAVRDRFGAGFSVIPAGDRLRRRFGLTPMEAAVARALIDGLSYREIAAEFEISTETVHSHVKAIHQKADVATSRQFIALFHSGR
jgi:DNA-binding CsgD family transcriptional regulator